MNLSLRHYEKKMNEKHRKQGGPCGKKKRVRKNAKPVAPLLFQRESSRGHDMKWNQNNSHWRLGECEDYPGHRVQKGLFFSVCMVVNLGIDVSIAHALFSSVIAPVA